MPGAPTTYRIAALPGDGVGPDVVAAGRRVLEVAAERFGFGLAWTEHVVGGAAIDAYGVPIRDEDLAVVASADAVLLGAVGGPRWDDPDAKVRPEQALFALRGGLELFANLRPVSVHPALAGSAPVRPELLAGVDLLIVRELTGGLYFGRPSEERQLADGRVAVDTLWYTEGEIARVVRLAFELARGRRGKVTEVDKANVLASSRLWRKVAEAIHRDFADVELDFRLVDAAAMHLVTRPAAFDVIVTENLFGDILSDEASVLAGSLGMLPSASIGARRTPHGLFGLYEPIHGSAPDIAGRDLANPIGAVLSAAMLLRWSLGREDAASAIEAAVARSLDDGYRTRDLVPGDPGAQEHADLRLVGTRAMAEAIASRIEPIVRAAPGPEGSPVAVER
ncbi:MAG TPA: 3-isopropylmalate dehydrogenase [Candidatus Dormibacteraeota bacterium]|nr:3-isopropylmalate dehydrogenase [Candidatus Dormibacteraeota bacterium]